MSKHDLNLYRTVLWPGRSKLTAAHFMPHRCLPGLITDEGVDRVLALLRFRRELRGVHALTGVADMPRLSAFWTGAIERREPPALQPIMRILRRAPIRRFQAALAPSCSTSPQPREESLDAEWVEMQPGLLGDEGPRPLHRPRFLVGALGDQGVEHVRHRHDAALRGIASPVRPCG